MQHAVAWIGVKSTVETDAHVCSMLVLDCLGIYPFFGQTSKEHLCALHDTAVPSGAVLAFQWATASDDVVLAFRQLLLCREGHETPSFHLFPNDPTDPSRGIEKRGLVHPHPNRGFGRKVPPGTVHMGSDQGMWRCHVGVTQQSHMFSSNRKPSRQR